jgi:hypothetical protein
MRMFRHIATTTAFSLVLLTGPQAFAGTDSQSQSQSGQTQNGQAQGQTPSGDQSTPYGGVPLTADQMNKEYQNLSPATRAALANQLKSKGIDGLSKMSESDARTAFAGLPPDVKAQIQAKWDSMSDEQRIALKKMGPSAVKELVASEMKEVMKQSMAPVTKPVEQVVQKAQSVAEKAKTIMQQGRDYVQGVIAKLKGQAAAQQPDNGQASN